MYGALFGDALPALSSAMGRYQLGGFGSAQINMMDEQNGWPAARLADPDLGNRWLHSDIKNIAFLYVYELFGDIAARGLR
jgi:hypothetical protein